MTLGQVFTAVLYTAWRAGVTSLRAIRLNRTWLWCEVSEQTAMAWRLWIATELARRTGMQVTVGYDEGEAT